MFIVLRLSTSNFFRHNLTKVGIDKEREGDRQYEGEVRRHGRQGMHSICLIWVPEGEKSGKKVVNHNLKETPILRF